jgi:hypothetical protein
MALALLYFLRSSLVRRNGGRQVTARFTVIASGLALRTGPSIRHDKGRANRRPVPGAASSE